VLDVLAERLGFCHNRIASYGGVGGLDRGNASEGALYPREWPHGAILNW